MINLLCEAKNENVLVKYLPQLEKEYAFWMRGSNELHANRISVNRVVLMPDGSILNRYWDESDAPRAESYKEDVELAENSEDKKTLFRNLRAACESGWDFSSRWFKSDGDFTSIHTTEIIPVDLNCLLYNLEDTIADAYQHSENKDLFEKYRALADKRKKAINAFCWDAQNNFYFDYDFIASELKKEWTLAAAYPLFFKVAETGKAEQVLKNLSEVLKAAGTSLDNVVKTTVFLADMNDFGEMNEVYASYFAENKPARATVQAGRLPRDAKVEIDCIAVVS